MGRRRNAPLCMAMAGPASGFWTSSRPPPCIMSGNAALVDRCAADPSGSHIMNIQQRRFALCIAVGLALCPILLAQPNPTFKAGETKQFVGKVVPLADLLKSIEAKLEPEASPHWLAL